ncbi:MAG: winged helix-turn-helix domain-containing protein [Candidatus Bathyarchaeota archaeon]|nr:winged helix-turn-helix domain-containing protein [Candidatus Bathyarchaeota archaeon]
MAESEEEIYSIMFTSLKHPVRRKILRMLADKPMTFMELVEYIGLSSSHLTYHLESLGELVFKIEDGRYKLSSFGYATVTAMKGVEEAPEIEVKRRIKLPFRWKSIIATLLVAVVLLATFSALQFAALNQVTANQNKLIAENQQLLSWGLGTNKVATLLRDVAQIDTTKYKITLLSNTVEQRQDFNVAEELLKYSLTSPTSNLDASFRFRDNHLSRYQLNPIESQPIYTRTQPGDVLENAKATLSRYRDYSGDAYLDQMANLIVQVNQLENTEVTEGNMKLKITIVGGTVDFLWMYTDKGIDFSAKSLRMTFQSNILTTLTDGYFLFTIGNTNLAISQDQAVTIAKNHVKTLTWNIDGKQTSGFNAQDTPVSVELLPHPRGDSVALVPYWYVVLRLDKVYAGGINIVTVGVYADTGEIADVQMLSG